MPPLVTTALPGPRTDMASERVGDVTVSVRPHVVRATIDRPTHMNAISNAVIEGLQHAIAVATATEARTLVIAGAGGTFCAGADLCEIERMREVDGRHLETFMVRLASVLRALETASFVSLAVVDGYAVAGGCEILLACDISVAAADARIGDRHQEYGLVPAAGGSVRLARTLPRARANYLLLTGELLSARNAAEWGLISVVVEPDDLESAVDGIVERLTTRSQDALATVKKMIWTANEEPRSEALEWERRLFMRHMASDDVSQGLSAFRDRRLPVFRPDD